VKIHLVLPLMGLAAAMSCGCGQPPPASFALHERTEELIPEARAEVVKVLREDFGAPNELVAWKKFPIDYGEADANVASDDPRSTPGWRLVQGRNSYMTHCLHCHGVAGDGNGPTARFLNPRPRDYRLGKFKFKSTLGPLKPSRDDLVHILKEGIPGTYMPSFVLLGDERLELIADYVRWLSIRGNTEYDLAVRLAGLEARQEDVARAIKNDTTGKLKRADKIAAVMKDLADELPGDVVDVTDKLKDDWTTAELPESKIVPTVNRKPPTKDSIESGRKLFLSKDKTKCVDCHGASGRGDGSRTQDFMEIPDKKPLKYEVVGLHDDWGRPVTPRDLTRGVYRGGRRPIDIFRRVRAGIPGTPMPGFGNDVLSEEQVWDVVNFVLSLPFGEKQSAYPSELKESEEDNKVAATTRE